MNEMVTSGFVGTCTLRMTSSQVRIFSINTSVSIGGCAMRCRIDLWVVVLCDAVSIYGWLCLEKACVLGSASTCHCEDCVLLSNVC